MVTRRLSSLSLKARLGLAAGLLTLATLLTAAMVVLGMAQVSDRLDSALAAERRLEEYAALSTQVSTFIVVAAEVIQRGQPPEIRAARTDTIALTLRQTFARLARRARCRGGQRRGARARCPVPPRHAVALHRPHGGALCTGA